ncbi:hypothetical protein [Paraburkholderia lacunae]|uniref:Uncharacterized protein n=1 Tax=Paraburkholderia lacunae TaxID=2211104 RepID=A0A370MYM0_9BURK|nr:hypothetical protein [Paraburkholderia lacunae]RDJ98473.1 hypothetical protein DLM46_33510 [Paraburkholderia lacunae]
MPLPADVELLASLSMHVRDVAPQKRAPVSARSRTSAFTGSRIRLREYELVVVEIGPFMHSQGDIVTFRARSVGEPAAPAGAILDTRWGVCEVVA